MPFYFTSAMYQPSDHFRTLVQAQHKSLQKIQELNTNDLSFTLDGVLSTLQQGSAENGVGSSVELRYHVEKAPCTDLRSDPTLLPKFLQNYAGGRVRQPRTPNTSAARKSLTNSTKTIPCQKECFFHDSHILTSSSFFSLQTQHDQSKENTNTTNKTKRSKEVFVFPMSSYVTQQLLFIKWTSDTSPSSRCLNW